MDDGKSGGSGSVGFGNSSSSPPTSSSREGGLVLFLWLTLILELDLSWLYVCQTLEVECGDMMFGELKLSPNSSRGLDIFTINPSRVLNDKSLQSKVIDCTRKPRKGTKMTRLSG